MPWELVSLGGPPEEDGPVKPGHDGIETALSVAPSYLYGASKRRAAQAWVTPDHDTEGMHRHHLQSPPSLGRVTLPLMAQSPDIRGNVRQVGLR